MVALRTVSLAQLKILQQAFRENVIPVDSPEAFQIVRSKEYGASYCIHEIIKTDRVG